MELRIVSIINKEELKEKTKEVAINIGSDIKSANKTSKVVMAVLLVLFLCTGAVAYNLYTTNAVITALKEENAQIKNRLAVLDKEITNNKFKFLEIANRVDNIKTNLENKLKEAKEVIVHEVKTSDDIISVLDDLSNLSTDL